MSAFAALTNNKNNVMSPFCLSSLAPPTPRSFSIGMPTAQPSMKTHLLLPLLFHVIALSLEAGSPNNFNRPKKNQKPEISWRMFGR